MIPEGWQKNLVGKYLEIISGFPFQSEFFAPLGKKGVPVIRIRDLLNGESKTHYCGEFDPDYLIAKNDILIGMDGEFHIARWKGAESLLNQRICKVVSNSNSILDTHFIYYFLQPHLVRMQHDIAATTVKHLSTKHLKSIVAPLPPLSEQKRIAAVLDSVDAAIEATQAVIEQTKKVKQGLLQTLLTHGIGHKRFKASLLGEIPEEWNVFPLGDLMVGKGEYGANVAAIDYDTNLSRYIRITDINDQGGLSSSNKKSIKLEDAKPYILEDNDFLFARSGATVGKTYRYKSAHGVCAYAGYLIRFRTNSNKLLPAYLEEITRSENYKRWIKRTLRAGAQPNINAQEYAAMIIALPSIAEQRAICDFANGINQQISTESAKLASLHQLKQGLMQDLLTGRVRVTDFKQPLSQLVENKNQLSKRINDFRLIAPIEPIYGHALIRSEITSQLSKADMRKIEKVVSLAVRLNALDKTIDRNEYRDVSGPHDGPSRHKIDVIFHQQKWFTIYSYKKKKIYMPSENFGGHKKDYQAYFSDYAEGIQRIINLFKSEEPDFCEKVATLYAVWNDFLIDGKKPTDNEIVADFREWHPSKKRFTQTELEQALNWIRSKKLIPEGKGRKTKVLAA